MNGLDERKTRIVKKVLHTILHASFDAGLKEEWAFDFLAHLIHSL